MLPQRDKLGGLRERAREGIPSRDAAVAAQVGLADTRQLESIAEARVVHARKRTKRNAKLRSGRMR